MESYTFQQTLHTEIPSQLKKKVNIYYTLCIYKCTSKERRVYIAKCCAYFRKTSQCPDNSAQVYCKAQRDTHTRGTFEITLALISVSCAYDLVASPLISRLSDTCF